MNNCFCAHAWAMHYLASRDECGQCGCKHYYENWSGDSDYTTRVKKKWLRLHKRIKIGIVAGRNPNPYKEVKDNAK